MQKVIKFVYWWYVSLGFAAFVTLESVGVYYLMKHFGCLPQ
jgi:hypothetical protein